MRLLGRAGRAGRTVWEPLLERERLGYRAGDTDEAAVTLMLGLAKAFERVSLPVVWAWAMRGHSEQWRVQFAGCVVDPLQTIAAILGDGAA